MALWIPFIFLKLKNTCLYLYQIIKMIVWSITGLPLTASLLLYALWMLKQMCRRVQTLLKHQNHPQACTNASGHERLQSVNISGLVADKDSLPVSSSVVAMDASPTVKYRLIEDIETNELGQTESNADTSDDKFYLKDGSPDAYSVDFKGQSSEEQHHVDSNSTNHTPITSFPGRRRAKPKRSPVLLSFKRLLNPIVFKKKRRRSKNATASE